MPADRIEGPISVFYSYSHRDEILRDELRKHLNVLERSGFIKEWHDRQILAGDVWDRQISEHLERAQLILLLISVDFLASKYCVDVEMTRALDRHDQGQARVIPVLLRPVTWTVLERLSRLQALPKDALPVMLWPNQDLAFENICEGILAMVIAWRSGSESSAAGSQEIARPRERQRGELPTARKRVLDAALPSRVQVGRAIVLVVMIRQPHSAGLRSTVELDASYGVSKEDVRSTKSFPMQFPLGEQGKLEPAQVVLEIECPDFEVKSYRKAMAIPPQGDSDPRVFLLTPARLGDLVVHLELFQGDSSIASCLLRTNAVSDANLASKKQVLVSIPLDTSRGPGQADEGQEEDAADRELDDRPQSVPAAAAPPQRGDEERVADAAARDTRVERPTPWTEDEAPAVEVPAPVTLRSAESAPRARYRLGPFKSPSPRSPPELRSRAGASLARRATLLGSLAVVIVSGGLAVNYYKFSMPPRENVDAYIRPPPENVDPYIRPPPKNLDPPMSSELQPGWCCDRGGLSQKTRAACSGEFFFDAQSARQRCVATAKPPGWCCQHGRVTSGTRSQCRGKFFFDAQSARQACAGPAEPMGWCCQDGRVIPAARGQCSSWFSDQRSAQAQCHSIIR